MKPGDALGHHTLLSRIGAGGMGEVWAAQDNRLGRRVAIKILPQHMAGDPERLARFAREARAVAALNHPNIVTIHSVEQHGDTRYLTMELVEGRPLTAVLAEMRGCLGRFLEMAVSLADALAAAHEQGITHRDLKPDNVMVTPEGRVKVLDFGLAKLIDPSPSAAGGSQLPTGTVTQEGKIIGTVAYMSPEQAQGLGVDHRSDIFSLGIVFYEMATGKRPFEGQTSVSILSSILKDTPRSVTDLDDRLPRHLGRIVRKCLAKEPGRRYQSTADLRNDLLELKEEIDSGILDPGAPGRPSPRRRSGGRVLLWTAAIVILGVVAAVGWWRGRPDRPGPSGPPSVRVEQLTDLTGEESWPSLSPDGRWILYVSAASGNNDIYLQAVGGRNPINLTADTPEDDSKPTFSPDGERIAFRSERQGGGIFVMGRTGESAKRLSDEGDDPSWSPDGKEIVYATEGVIEPYGRAESSQLWIVDVATGDRRHLEVPDAVQPRWSPDGSRIAFWTATGGQRDIGTLPAAGGPPVMITEDLPLDWSPAWDAEGRQVWFASDRSGSMNLWRAPIDPETGRAAGPPEPVTVPSPWVGEISLSRDGRRIAYQSRTGNTRLERLLLDETTGTIRGEPVPITRGSGSYKTPSVSPDGQWIAASTGGPQEDLVVMRLDGSGLRQILDDPAKDRFPRWSPDGRSIVFYSNRVGGYDVWSIRPDGSGLTDLTQTPGDDEILAALSPDGRLLAYGHWPGRGGLLDLEAPRGEGNPRTVETPEGDSWWITSWSPDGKLIAGSVAPGYAFWRIAVYDVAENAFRVFEQEGLHPVWLGDDRRLLFARAGALMLMDVRTGEAHEILDLAPDEIAGLGLVPGGGGLIVARQHTEADIWMATLAAPGNDR